MKLALSGGKIITPFEIIQEGVILIENLIIKNLRSKESYQDEHTI